jgi:type I restriction enzyme M protein
MPKKKPSESKSTANIGFEANILLAADKRRNNMDAAEYKYIILGLIVLKYISDSFEEHHAKLAEGKADYAGANLEDLDEYKAEIVFWVTTESRRSHLQANAKPPTIGKLVDDGMVAIERDNTGLNGVLPKDFARHELYTHRLGELTDLISTIGHEDKENRSKVVLGRVYEYVLTQFASTEGKTEGHVNSPSCVVRCLVEMLEPYKGRIYDPCCGSSGIFVQSEKFVESHGGKLADIRIYGQESDATTRRLAALNFVLRGIEADFGTAHADTFRRDLHPDLRADYALTNPPFSDSDWFRQNDDVRWAYSIAPKLNANFARMMRSIKQFAPKGMTGFVLANGNITFNQSSKGNICWAFAEADLLDGMIELPVQIFHHTQIRVCLWFLARNKNASKLGDRCKQMLFTNARIPNDPCRNAAHVGTERTDGAIQVMLGDNGGAKCECTFNRDFHNKAA